MRANDRVWGHRGGVGVRARRTRTLRRIGAGLVLGLAAAGLVAPAVYAATPPAGSSGALDPTFDGDGIAVVSIPGLDNLVAVTRPIIQSDGKIVVAAIQPGTAASVVLVRLLSTGIPDPAFGSGGGWVRTAVGTGSPDDGAQIVLQPDGKIIVAGGFNLNYKITLQRFLSNGTPDNSFGSSSVARPHYYDTSNSGVVRSTGVVLQTDGKIVVSAWSGQFERFSAARFTTSGNLDTSFSGDGIAEHEIKISGQKKPAKANDVVLTSDSKVILVGSIKVGTKFDTAVAKLTTAGALDTSFGTGGVKTLDLGGQRRRPRRDGPPRHDR